MLHLELHLLLRLMFRLTRSCAWSARRRIFLAASRRFGKT
jgi:hypothetical protein